MAIESLSSATPHYEVLKIEVPPRGQNQYPGPMTHDVAGFLFRLKGDPPRRSKYIQSAPAFAAIGRGAELGTNITGAVTRSLNMRLSSHCNPLSPRISETTPEKGRKAGFRTPSRSQRDTALAAGVPSWGTRRQPMLPKILLMCMLSTGTATRQPVRSIPT